MREPVMERRAEERITVRLRHPERDAVLTLFLDAGTRFGELDAALYSHGFVPWQKPGYGYLIAGHGCSLRHCLRDYLPAGEDTLEVRVFPMPQIMV